MTTSQDLHELAHQTANRLAARRVTVVFAESCTGGLIAATLATVPGISHWLCGSAVVYQLATKAEWLGVPGTLLDDPGPVSAEVAEAMARGVLERTPHARMAASVTGHLGPNAPPALDGLLYAAVAMRHGSDAPSSSGLSISVRQHRLDALEHDEGAAGEPLRVRRQREAAAFVLSLVGKALDTDFRSDSGTA